MKKQNTTLTVSTAKNPSSSQAGVLAKSVRNSHPKKKKLSSKKPLKKRIRTKGDTLITLAIRKAGRPLSVSDLVYEKVRRNELKLIDDEILHRVKMIDMGEVKH